MPSTLNCTTVTPTLSEALALRGTVPDTVALLAGAVRLTVGALVSPARPDCWVCGDAAFICAKADGAAVASAAVTGADNAVIDVSARAC